MSQGANKPNLKIKLNVKREQSLDAPNAAAPPASGHAADAPVHLAGHLAPSGGPQQVGAGPNANPPKIKLKLKQEGGAGGSGAAVPSVGKRPAGAMPPTMSKKIKLGAGLGAPSLGTAKIKLKAPGFGGFLAQPPARAQGTAAPVLPMARMGPGQQHAKRGRKPKVGRPPSAGDRQGRRLSDEVKYHIAAPPPRSFSLRATASQGTLHTESARGAPSPLSVAMLDTAATAAGLASPPAVDQGTVAWGGGAPGSERPPSREELSRLLNRIWEKDVSAVFRQPVTEAEVRGWVDPWGANAQGLKCTSISIRIQS